MTVRVYDLAHARTGDKGDTVNISVIAFDERGYRHLGAHLTPDVVQAAFANLASGPVHRHVLPNILAYNFVIERALMGGVTANLRQDLHGKSLSFLMLGIALPDPPDA